MPTPNNSFAGFQNVVRAVVRNASSFTPTEGPQAGQTFYFADSEIPANGLRWSTLRVKVRNGGKPVPVGEMNLVITSFSDKDGTALANVLHE